MPLNTLFLVKSLYRIGGFSSGASLFYNTVALLFLLAVLNQAIKRWRPKRAFRTGELLTVYAIIGVSTGLVGSVSNVGGGLAATITYPFGPLAVGLGWPERVWPNLPTWLTVRDSVALERLWTGGSNPYAWSVARIWAVPALWWASFVGAVMWVCLCLNSLVRKRWSDEERLAFPLTTVPVQMADERFGLMHNKAWWTGFAAAFGVTLWDGLSGVMPDLPHIPLRFDFAPYVWNRPPWDALGPVAVGWEPWFVGLCYLMPLDLAFSLGVFSVLSQSAVVVTSHLGGGGSADPFLHTQRASGAIAFALALLWLDRRYFLQVLRRTLGLTSRLQETEGEEAFSYRRAAVGLLLGLTYLWWFWARAGVSGWVLAAFLGLYFTIMAVMSRVRAQMGPPTFDLMMPDTILRQGLGEVALGPRALGMFSLLYPYLYWQDNHPAPVQLETLKMAEGGRMEPRRIALALALAVPLTVLCYFWGQVHFGYSLGMASGKTHPAQLREVGWVTAWLDYSLRQPAEMNPGAAIPLGCGAFITLALLFMKLRFHWWPLHPIAFPISYNWMISYATPVIFLTWLAKSLLLRYGGLHAHRSALPLFLGLLVGGFCASCVAVLVFPLPRIRP